MNIKRISITSIILIIYWLWWISGILFLKTYDFHTNIAGGIALLNFFESSVLISVILFIGFSLVQRSVPDGKSTYKRQIVYLLLPYLLIVAFYSFQYIRILFLNRYKEDLTEFNFEQSHVWNKMQLESSLGSSKN